MGRKMDRCPIPAALIATSSLSACILVRPMMTPTRAAIGHVNAITFGISAKLSCQTRLDGMFALKKMSEKRLPCWTKSTTLSRSHEKMKYGTTARIRYANIVQPNRISSHEFTANERSAMSSRPTTLTMICRKRSESPVTASVCDLARSTKATGASRWMLKKISRCRAETLAI